MGDTLTLIHLALFAAGQVVTAGAIWGALRADVRHLVGEVAEAKQSVQRAHERIDDVLQYRRQGR